MYHSGQGGCVCWGGQWNYENSVPSVQFAVAYECSKTIKSFLKFKVLKNNTKEGKKGEEKNIK